MFDLFKKKPEQATKDVKSIRDQLLQFIKTRLAQLEGGEGTRIKGLQLFLTPQEAERHLYEAAVYMEQDGRMKEEVQRIADDFAIALPPHWDCEISFGNNLPEGAVKAPQLDAALFIRTKEAVLKKTVAASIKVLAGEAEKEEYPITSESGPVNIGRDKKVQTRDNFYRINAIAFAAESADESNKYISRQHAHIEWEAASGSFLLFADEGGVPPRNKIKIRPALGGDPVKLQSTKLGYALQDGDQIILGEKALLEFCYSPR